jgi:hypothetical protein
VIPIYPPNFVCRGYNNYKPLNVFYYCFIIYMGTNNAVTTFEPVNKTLPSDVPEEIWLLSKIWKGR